MEKENSVIHDVEIINDSMSEHEKAVVLANDANEIMKEAEEQVNTCMLLLDKDLKNLKEAKSSLKSEALEDTQKILDELGYEASMLKEAEIEFGYKEEDKEEKVEVKTVSSGKFTSFLIALFVGIIIAIGSLFASAKSIGITLDINRLTDIDYLLPILAPIGKLFIADANGNIGGAVLVGIVLIVMYIVYLIRVSLIATQNFKDAQAIHEKAEFYCTSKEECKKEMDRVDAHLNETIKTIDYYKVLLAEQNMKLRRILFIEEKQHFDFYHYKSQMEIENTQKLVNSINELLGTPMAEGGRLSTLAEEVLAKSKAVINTQLQSIYDKNIDDVL
jgi:hypothetical protein